jgi:hypothetical protein
MNELKKAFDYSVDTNQKTPKEMAEIKQRDKELAEKHKEEVENMRAGGYAQNSPSIENRSRTTKTE